MKDHHVFIWYEGWRAMPDSHCFVRKSGRGNNTIKVATCPNLSASREVVDEYGMTLDVANEVSLRADDIRGSIAMDDKIEVQQPTETGDWREFRVGAIKLEGGLMTLTLKDVNSGR